MNKTDLSRAWKPAKREKTLRVIYKKRNNPKSRVERTAEERIEQSSMS